MTRTDDGRVLVEADHEVFTLNDAIVLSNAIREVATGKFFYVAEGGTHFLTREQYDAIP